MARLIRRPSVWPRGHRFDESIAFEILAGFGVLIPRWRRAAAAILVALMIGALWTHAVQAEFTRLIPPLVLGGLAFLLYSSPVPRRTRTDVTSRVGQ